MNKDKNYYRKCGEETLKRIGTWLIRGNTGQSSLSLCAIYFGTDERSLNYPYDLGDFDRCIGFLNLLTKEEEKFVLRKAALLNEDWARIYSSWEELMILYHENASKDLTEKLDSIRIEKENEIIITSQS